MGGGDLPPHRRGAHVPDSATLSTALGSGDGRTKLKERRDVWLVSGRGLAISHECQAHADAVIAEYNATPGDRDPAGWTTHPITIGRRGTHELDNRQRVHLAGGRVSERGREWRNVVGAYRDMLATQLPKVDACGGHRRAALARHKAAVGALAPVADPPSPSRQGTSAWIALAATSGSEPS